MQDMIKETIKRADQYEPWQGYYLVRGMEMGHLFKFLGCNNLGDVLDIGCANAFTSLLMSQRAKSVTAADLYLKDKLSHSQGLDSAKAFLARANDKRVELLSASFEKLPFKNESFNTVYAGHVLHYIKDRAATLEELKRVMKPDGIAVLVLPNFIERMWGILQFYVYLVMKAFIFLGRRFLKNGASDSRKSVSGRIGKLKEDYKYFPFPGPGGAYKNSAVEMIRHIPFSWNREFENNGFKVARSFCTNFAPYPLLLTISVKVAYLFSGLDNAVTKFCGDKPILKYLGYNYCVVLKK